MRVVRISELKANLSKYLRLVRRGHTLTIMNRTAPIARLVPYTESPPLRVRVPAAGAPAPNRVKLPPPVPLPGDVRRLLKERR